VNSTVSGLDTAKMQRKRMSRLKVLRIYYLEAKYEFIRSLRNPGFGFPFLVMPVVLFLVFSALGSPQKADPDLRLGLFSGMAILGIMGPAMFGFGAILAGERQFKLLEFKRAIAMPAAAHLIGKFVCAMAYAAMVILVMIAVGLAMGRISLNATQAVMVGLVLWLGVLPFCAIGFFIGARASAHVANGITTIVYMPQLYFSGLFFPLPAAIGWIALFMPPFYLNQLVLGVGGAKHIYIVGAWFHVLFLAVLTVGLTLLTVKKMTRHG